jgi:hypothetical protein
MRAILLFRSSLNFLSGLNFLADLRAPPQMAGKSGTKPESLEAESGHANDQIREMVG